jgi:hypothetical protein
VGLGGNLAHMKGLSNPAFISSLLYFVSIFETMDQYFIMNLTCSSLIDGASFVVSAFGLIVSSFLLYFKCRMDIELQASSTTTSDTTSSKSDKEMELMTTLKTASSKTWKNVYLVIGCGAWCAGFYVGAYAVNIYPVGSLEHTMGMIDIAGCFFVAFVLYFFGNTAAKYLFLLSSKLAKLKKANKLKGQVEMGAEVAMNEL